MIVLFLPHKDLRRSAQDRDINFDKDIAKIARSKQEYFVGLENENVVSLEDINNITIVQPHQMYLHNSGETCSNV